MDFFSAEAKKCGRCREVAVSWGFDCIREMVEAFGVTISGINWLEKR